MIYLVFGLLAITIIRNIFSPNRLLIAAIISFITSFSYYIYYMGPYETIVDSIGYWGWLAVVPTLSIIALAVIGGQTAFALMILFLILNLIHLACFFLDGLLYLEYGYQFITWAVFYIEILILLSKRFSYGFVGAFSKMVHPHGLDSWLAHYLHKNRFE